MDVRLLYSYYTVVISYCTIMLGYCKTLHIYCTVIVQLCVVTVPILHSYCRQLYSYFKSLHSYYKLVYSYCKLVYNYCAAVVQLLRGYYNLLYSYRTPTCNWCANIAQLLYKHCTAVATDVSVHLRRFPMHACDEESIIRRAVFNNDWIDGSGIGVILNVLELEIHTSVYTYHNSREHTFASYKLSVHNLLLVVTWIIWMTLPLSVSLL